MNKEVEILTSKDANEYIEFIKEVFGYEPSVKSITNMIKKETVLAIKNNDRIIASISLELKDEYIKEKKYYHVNYFGVLKQYRRMGYATRIFEEVEKLVEENKIDYLELTSGNQRKSAHYFYKKNDFKIKDTTVFIKFYNRD